MHEPKCEEIGKLTGGKWSKLHDISRRVYGVDGLSPTLHTAGGGNTELKIIVPEATKKGYDVAAYGDSINTAFPNSKTRRGRVGHGVAQTLTTSDAQQVVVEPTEDCRFYQQAIETLQENDCEPGDTIDAYNKRVNKDGVSPTITTRPDGFKTAILPVVKSDDGDYWGDDYKVDKCGMVGEICGCRIRKLTPRECFRLMGVKKDDYEHAAKHQSISSQYHLAGDSIGTSCLMAIFGELLQIDYNTKITELTEELLDVD